MTSIPVMFQGGSYGTYLLWVLQMLFSDEEFYDPQQKNGNSHNLKNVVEISIDIDKWLNDPTCCANTSLFLKVHPKVLEQHSLFENVNKLTDYYGKSILLYPNKSTYLLHCNNYIYKIWDNIWEGPLSYINLDNLYDNFPVPRNTNIKDVPNWIIREWLSYNFFDSMNSQIEWFLPDRLTTKNCLVLYIDELLYNLDNTVNRIQNFVNIPLVKPVEFVHSFHSENISRQRYLTQDTIAANIIKSILNKTNYTWNQQDLTIITESWIQREIRNQGYDFKCNELNNFPTSTNELIKLL